MNFNLINQKPEYEFSQYFLNCDLINKYITETTKSHPKLKQIKINLVLNQLIDIRNTKKLSNLTTHKIKNYFLFYVFSALLPWIKFYKKLNLNGNSTNCYSIELKFINLFEKYNFLQSLSENYSVNNNTLIFFQKKNFYFNFILNLIKVFEFKSIFIKNEKYFNLKNIKFNVTFLILNANKNIINLYFLNNYKFF